MEVHRDWLILKIAANSHLRICSFWHFRVGFIFHPISNFSPYSDHHNVGEEGEILTFYIWSDAKWVAHLKNVSVCVCLYVHVSHQEGSSSKSGIIRDSEILWQTGRLQSLQLLTQLEHHWKGHTHKQTVLVWDLFYLHDRLELMYTLLLLNVSLCKELTVKSKVVGGN